MTRFLLERARREIEYSTITIEAETEQEAVEIAESDYTLDWKVLDYDVQEDSYKVVKS